MSDAGAEILAVGDAKSVAKLLQKKGSTSYILLATSDSQHAEKWRERLGRQVDYPSVQPNASEDECEVSVTTTRFKVYVDLVRPWVFRMGSPEGPRNKLTTSVLCIAFRLRTKADKDALAAFMKSKADDFVTPDRNEFSRRVFKAAGEFGFKADQKNVVVSHV